MVAGAGAGDVQQVSFGVVDLFEIGIVGGGLDPLLERNDFVVAGHHDYRAELQAFGEMHCRDRYVTFHRLQIFIKDFVGKAGFLHRVTSAVQLRVRPDEDTDLVRHNSFFIPPEEPVTDCLAFLIRIFQNADFRCRPVEDGNRASAFFCDSINVGQFGSKQSVGLRSDLVGRPVIDLQRSGSAANINTERFPRERCWKMR